MGKLNFDEYSIPRFYPGNKIVKNLEAQLFYIETLISM